MTNPCSQSNPVLYGPGSREPRQQAPNPLLGRRFAVMLLPPVRPGRFPSCLSCPFGVEERDGTRGPSGSGVCQAPGQLNHSRTTLSPFTWGQGKETDDSLHRGALITTVKDPSSGGEPGGRGRGCVIMKRTNTKSTGSLTAQR
jgi:hypothetical protein